MSTDLGNITVMPISGMASGIPDTNVVMSISGMAIPTSGVERDRRRSVHRQDSSQRAQHQREVGIRRPPWATLEGDG